MILEAMYNGEFYPCETVVPTSPEYRKAVIACEKLMEQMKATEGVTEELKRTQQMEWVQRCNNIHNRAEEIILQEMIYS